MNIKTILFYGFCIACLVTSCGRQPVMTESNPYSVSIVHGYTSNEFGSWLYGSADSTVLIMDKNSGVYKRVDYTRSGNGYYRQKCDPDSINLLAEKKPLKSDNCVLFNGHTIYCDNGDLFGNFPGNIDVMKTNAILTKASSSHILNDDIFVVRFSEMSNKVLDGPCYIRKEEYGSLFIDSIQYFINKNLLNTVKYYFSDKSKIIVGIINEERLPKLITYSYFDLNNNDAAVSTYVVKFNYSSGASQLLSKIR
jgi:hypothetical protein